MTLPLEVLYWLVAAVEVYSEYTGNEEIRFFSKPLLMIVLIAFFWVDTVGRRNIFHKILLGAFVFSWVGDVALMFVPKDFADQSLMGLPKHPHFFLAGLGGFLITHILYIVAFRKVSFQNVPAVLPSGIWILTPLVIYMVFLLARLVPAISAVPETQPFLAPVLVYTMTIALMVAYSFNRYGRVSDRSFYPVFVGALLFMVSDSIIAVNKFLQPFESAGIFIMIFYVSAQYFIAKGSLYQDAAQQEA